MEPIIAMDALSLEYKLKYGCATGNLNIADVVNDPVRAGVCSVSSLGCQEQLLYFGRMELRPLLDDIPDPCLIGQKRP